MANILTVGLVIGFLRPESRRFVWGFVIFGALALALFMIIALLHVEDIVVPFLGLASPLVRPTGPSITNMGIMIAYAAYMAMLTLPQIAIAVAGGFLVRNFRIS